ncbi:UNKNOWN [Stylonychia lemnae]|uniref:Uncharacterized protein n=1 Tax=Stylonychia lemnae TaxID=5949 RepID=A0A078AS03_STYLE|nr:UNKNOWN [Stylonychia lemnae]|eukprot:CDW83663.1 UNKNOWN [Stylonychia lemnae]
MMMKQLIQYISPKSRAAIRFPNTYDSMQIIQKQLNIEPINPHTVDKIIFAMQQNVHYKSSYQNPGDNILMLESCFAVLTKNQRDFLGPYQSLPKLINNVK